MIKFDSEICTNFESASQREWLETNGIGGFASSTISGANTRRYHGLLTAATRPPLGRVTMLSKFEETLTIDDKIFQLSSNKYPNAIDPEGFKYHKIFSPRSVSGLDLRDRRYRDRKENFYGQRRKHDRLPMESKRPNRKSQIANRKSN